MYNNIIKDCDNTEFQNQVISKLKDQINYSVNN